MKTKVLILAIGLITMVSNQSIAQNFNIKGIDHVGINVTDIDRAMTFFSEILGFEKATELNLAELDVNWEKLYKIHKNVTIERIVIIQSGNGSKIELFQNKSEERNIELPYGDDLTWYHIAFYTDDIYNSMAYLKSKGVTFLDEPFRNSNGELWTYFMSPWGTQMELISYSEKTTDKEENLILKIQTKMSKVDIEALAKKHLDIWTEKNAEKRNESIKKVYKEDVEIVDPFFVINGHSNLNDFIEDLQKKHPDFDFSLAQPIESHNNIARLFWQFGTENKPDTITGQDIFVIENGKIKSLYIFIDGLKN
ncbi:VOC family protein [Flavobacterium sp. C4GT6]|uniref:VOC family protein n=1 Tax=Flavobacterium sp. C4GT6 TaxID=3103818 RepID=UPI002ED1B7DC